VTATLEHTAPLATPQHAAGAPAAARKWRPDIQGLRAVAVLLVVLYHAGVPYLTGGFVGVDVFFVISGFLITGHLVREARRRGRINYLGFYGSRARRLLPSAAIVALATIVVDRVWGSIFQVKAIAWDAVFTSFYGLNWRLAAEGINYQEGAGRISPFQHFWSLAVEEQFYIAWPLVIGACVLIGGRHRFKLLAATLTAITAVSLWQSVTVTAHNAPYGYFSLQTRGWELAAGALVALASDLLARFPARFAAAGSWLGLTAIVWAAFAYDDRTLFPGSAATVPVFGTALVIAAGCVARPARWSAERVLDNPPAQGIGRVSYGWYLWHWPMLVLLPAMFGRDFTWPMRVEVVLLAGWFAALSYNLVERQASRSRRGRGTWLAIGAGLSGSTAAAGVAVLLTLPALVGGSAVSTIVLSDDAVVSVNHALMPALAVQNVPSNLTPTLEDAAMDQPASGFDGCHLDYLKVRQPQSCIYGDPGGSQTVILLGDSHAQQWLPALDAAGKTNGWRVVEWTKSACPIADVQVYNDMLRREYSECDQWRTWIVKQVISAHPSLVLLSQSDSVVGTQITNKEWAARTAKAARNLIDAGLHVTYILDTPYHESGVPECLAAHLHNAGACTIETAHAYPYQNRRGEVAATLKVSSVPAVSAEPWVCAAGACPAVVGNMAVYRDASHISATYSQWLGPVLAGLIPKA
jgi:peptidoglycan/LPS O-acetylase OafA/YrhL